jgi:hypothetical protein
MALARRKMRCMQLPTGEMTSEDLRRNMMRTYFTLRLGIVVLSAALPLILLGYSLANFGGLVMGSMSAFYGGVMRDWFVGILWAIGFFLINYKGFSALEDWLLNFAGGFAVLTAMTPCDCWGGEALVKSAWHTGFAVAFFICMASVCLFCARDTITLLPTRADRERFERAYLIIAVLLLLSPLAAAVTAYFARAGDSRVFFIEWFAVWVFAGYWAVKSVEFKITSAERRALYGALKNVKGVGVVAAAPDVDRLQRLSQE